MDIPRFILFQSVNSCPFLGMIVERMPLLEFHYLELRGFFLLDKFSSKYREFSPPPPWFLTLAGGREKTAMPFSKGIVHNGVRKTRPEFENGSPIRLSVSKTVHNKHVENQARSRIRNLSEFLFFYFHCADYLITHSKRNHFFLFFLFW